MKVIFNVIHFPHQLGFDGIYFAMNSLLSALLTQIYVFFFQTLNSIKDKIYPYHSYILLAYPLSHYYASVSR